MIFWPYDTELFKRKALYWASRQGVCMFVNGNSYNVLYNSFPEILAVGVKRKISSSNSCFNKLKSFYGEKEKWLFGYFSYDLKNELENLSSNNINNLNLPLIYFIEPETVIFFKSTSVEILSENPEKIYNQINNQLPKLKSLPKLDFNTDTSHEEYLDVTSKIKNHIVEGDIYELNYCIRYFTEVANLDTLSVYEELNRTSPTPFSVYLNTPEFSIISASPERFLKKEGQKVISQPMKGTIKRGENAEADKANSIELRNSEKEQAENMMIVDLVRNDLSKSCKTDTVTVEELFGVYGFPKVFQMISTVTGTIEEDCHFCEVIQNAFPMGSMTGAPKIKAMELIDKYENSFRGAFSGAAGFISPEKDFDFNVLIRTLFYNKSKSLLSFSVGSAITYDCDLHKEYEECQLKAENIFKLFS